MELKSLTGASADAVRRLRRLVLEQKADRQELEAALADIEGQVVERQGREEEAQQRAGRVEAVYEEVRAELLRYRELFEFAPDAYFVTDLGGVIQQANHAAAVLLHTRKEFLRGKPLPFFVAEGQRPEFFLRLARLRNVEPGTVQGWEVRLGPHRAPPAEAAVTVTVDASPAGRPERLRWLVRDITLGKRTEEALRAERDFADSLVDTAQVAVAVLDGGGRLMRVNAYLEALAGFAARDLLGRDWCAALVAGPGREQAGRLLEQALQRGQSNRAVHPLSTHAGRQRSVEWSLKALALRDGDTAATVLAIGHDVTDLERAQRQMLQMERLAAIGQMAAGLAHEGRNALQRSRACLEMLRWQVEGKPDALDLVARAQKAQEDLLHLYEDVRDYAAPIHLDGRPCDLADVWREAWAHVTSLCPGRAVELREVTADVDLICNANRYRLEQVFRNLLENSLACADPVCVQITCSAAELAGGPALRIAVRDNGPGLGPEQRQRLFEPFYTTKVKGSGLGLAIARRIVEAHGGEIGLGHPPEGGAEIVLTLPRGIS